jgi:hypothetical protein
MDEAGNVLVMGTFGFDFTPISCGGRATVFTTTLTNAEVPMES